MKKEKAELKKKQEQEAKAKEEEDLRIASEQKKLEQERALSTAAGTDERDQSEEDRWKAFYQMLLGRAASSAEFSFWVDETPGPQQQPNHKDAADQEEPAG